MSKRLKRIIIENLLRIYNNLYKYLNQEGFKAVIDKEY
jgi:hypothetical protein